MLHLTDDGRHFKLDRVKYLSASQFKGPIDLAAAVPEVANPRFSSHTTLAANSDLFIANRGDGSLLRIAPDGRVFARAQVQVEGIGIIGPDRLRAIAVSADAQRIWLTLEGELPQHRGYEGLVLEVTAFDADGAYAQVPVTSPITTALDTADIGAKLFAREFSPVEGLGPLFNQRSCVACHNEPSVGGSSSVEANFALRVARSTRASGRVEPLDDVHGPVARRHSTRELLTGIGGRQSLTGSRRVWAFRGTPTWSQFGCRRPLYAVGTPRCNSRRRHPRPCGQQRRWDSRPPEPRARRQRRVARRALRLES